jgi:hypothetical protein
MITNTTLITKSKEITLDIYINAAVITRMAGVM